MPKPYITLVVVAMLMAVLIIGCQSPAGGEEQTVKPVAVEVASVARGEVNTKTILSGQITAETEVPVLSKLPLQVVAVKVKVGDQVEVGQALLQLDNKDLQEQVWQAEAGLKVAEAGGYPPAQEESPGAAGGRGWPMKVRPRILNACSF